MAAEIKVPISPGELVDKITILEIKSARMQDPAKLANVRAELALLQDTWRLSAYASHDITSQWAALRTINEKLWDVEDLIRDKERARTFDQEFIELARAVYVTNRPSRLRHQRRARGNQTRHQHAPRLENRRGEELR
jgi:hypothetical protein